MRTWAARTVVCVLVAFAPAHGVLADTFGLGNGSRGTLTVLSGQILVVNSYAVLTADVPAGTTTVSLDSSAAFNADNLIMLWQPAGFPAVAGNAGPIDVSTSQTGQWELARIATIDTQTQISVSAPLQHSYASNLTQVVFVPEYVTLTVSVGGQITAPPFDGYRGGIVAFLALGTVSVNGSIDVRGKGFTGGAFSFSTASTCGGAIDSANRGQGIGPVQSDHGTTNLANGGGGGCVAGGGGGGAHSGAGGSGGASSSFESIGGSGGAGILYSLIDHLFLGGGGGAGIQSVAGGAGTGGAGGGVVFLRALTLAGIGVINASGGDAPGGASGGHGGGGAGGGVHIRLGGAAGTTICSSLFANGGDGGPTLTSSGGGGGGGGGGRMLVQSSSGCSPALSQFNAGLGGTAIAGNHGGQVGANGAVEPPPPGFFCTSNMFCSPGTPVCDMTINACVACPIVTAVASGSATICPGSSTPLSGSGGTSCSWTPTTGLSDANSCSPAASPSTTTTYTLHVTDSNGCPSTNNPTVTVTVGGTLASSASSMVVTDMSSRPADGVSFATITVALRDSSSCAVAGKNVSLSAGATSATITPLNPNTNANGEATFTIRDSHPEAVTVSANDVTDGVAVTQTAMVAFIVLAPAQTAATASSETSVALSWTPVDGAQSYEAYRATTINGAYQFAASSMGTTATDSNGLAANTTYVYRVRAIGATGTGPFGGLDPATTVMFSDPDLNDVTFKADHINQLRIAINAMRFAANLMPAQFSDDPLPSEAPVLAQYVTQLRSQLNATRIDGYGLPVIPFADPSIQAGDPIRASHLLELRGGTE